MEDDPAGKMLVLGNEMSGCELTAAPGTSSIVGNDTRTLIVSEKKCRIV